MTELKVTKGGVIKAYKNTSEEGKRLLENLYGKEYFKLSITDRIKTFDDVLNELEINKLEFEKRLTVLSIDEAAYRKVKLIVKALNEGWTPNWEDHDERKYFPWFEMGSSSGVGFSSVVYDSDCTFSRVGSRLCFKSSELARYAGEQFEDIYKDYFTK